MCDLWCAKFVDTDSVIKVTTKKSSHKSHKQARKQRGTGTHEKQRDERAWLNKITAIFLKKQLLTPEHGQFRPKHVVILKILKSAKC
jgi:hypothetical protein